MSHMQADWQVSPFAKSQRGAGGANSPAHDEAFARLQFLVDNRRRLGVLLGPAGVGKSALLAQLAHQQRRAGAEVACVDLLGLSEQEFLWTLAARLKAPVGTSETRFKIWRAIGDRLLEHRCQNLHTILLFDHADQTGGDVQTLVLRLLHADPSPEVQLTVVLAAEPERVERIDHRLLELCDLRIDLEPWTEADTADFIEQRLMNAGRPGDTFDPTAIARLHECTGGVPRRVRQLADLAFLAGIGQQLSHVDADTIDSVHAELSLAGVLDTHE